MTKRFLLINCILFLLAVPALAQDKLPPVTDSLVESEQAHGSFNQKTRDAALMRAMQDSDPYARIFQPRSSDPSSQPNGTVWYNSSTDVVKVQLNSGVATFSTSSGLPVVDTTAISKGSSDATKLVRFEVDGFTTGQTRVITPPDADTKLPVFSQTITFSGPTAARTVTIPDSNFTAVASTQNGSPQGWEDTGAVRTVAAASTQYNCLFGCISVTFNATESNRINISPVAGALSNAYIRTGGAQPADAGMVCTFRNTTTTTDSSVVVTIGANASAGTFTDLTHSMAVAAGDNVVLKCVNSSASASAGLVEVRFLFTRTS